MKPFSALEGKFTTQSSIFELNFCFQYQQSNAKMLSSSLSCLVKLERKDYMCRDLS